jgi:hypothetical protein
MAGHPLICDCRLALALVQAAPYLRNLGITEVHFSSAYSYRLMPSGKLSRHARGLAIDIHRVTANGEILRAPDHHKSHYNHFHLAIISSQRWNRGRR